MHVVVDVMIAVPASIVNPTILIPSFFFFNDTATTEIYTLSLHDALPILDAGGGRRRAHRRHRDRARGPLGRADRKSTRLNSSHSSISYAVFCLKKKKKTSDIENDQWMRKYDENDEVHAGCARDCHKRVGD